MSLRFPTRADLPAIRSIVDEAQLFPPEILDSMIEPFFTDSEASGKWCVFDDEKLGVVGVAYCRPEPLTDGTWNLLAIGLRQHVRGGGIGAQLISHIVGMLSNARLLIVETSSADQYVGTCRFYLSCGFERVARVPQYWAEGEDKIIFSKALL